MQTHRILIAFILFTLANLLQPQNLTAITFEELATKANTVIDTHETAFPLYQQPSYDVDNDDDIDTLQSISQQYAQSSPEQQAELKARLFCSPKPSNSDTNADNWARWRLCTSIGHLILNWHHTYLYQKKPPTRGSRPGSNTHLLTPLSLRRVINQAE